jgi:hypothetical protein
MQLLLALLSLTALAESSDVGPLVRWLWLVQQYGMAGAMDPKNDQRVKGVLSKALAKDGVITLSELGGLMVPEVFNKLAGPDSKLDSAEVKQALDAATPESRTKLAPKLTAHADYLATTFDLIDPMHRPAHALCDGAGQERAGLEGVGGAVISRRITGRCPSRRCPGHRPDNRLSCTNERACGCLYVAERWPRAGCSDTFQGRRRHQAALKSLARSMSLRMLHSTASITSLVSNE